MKTTENLYNNPENLNPEEIHKKLMHLYHSCIRAKGTTVNRNKRINILESYKTDLITKEQWIHIYCN